jgi:outer membrane receptor protein involved in Fe transport
MNYLDLAASLTIARRLTLRLGVNNAQDRDPPLVSGGVFNVNGNTFVNLYDALGRHVFASVTAKY